MNSNKVGVKICGTKMNFCCAVVLNMKKMEEMNYAAAATDLTVLLTGRHIAETCRNESSFSNTR